jgi:CheY-like chemotaxis protein
MRSLTILYVEDHALLLRLMRELLEVQGWLVETCRDGWTALEKIEGESDYGVIVVDDNLPDLCGLEIVRRVRRLAHRRRTPIILLSANERAGAALLAGANVCLGKTVDADAIVEAIRRLTAGR